jgi:hypothetical protein
MTQTLEQIRDAGLAALRERLGVVGMIRFLQQFDQGSGDYAKERHKWVDETSFEELVRQIKARRKKQGKECYHVEAHEKGWAVRREASTRVRSVHATKREAIKAGRRLARNAGAELVVHRRDRRNGSAVG